MGQGFTLQKGLCVTHISNQQSQHRGQIRPMLHARAIKLPESDPVFVLHDM